MVKKATPKAAVDGQRVYRVVVDALLNPVRDTPFSGEVTRAVLEDAGMDVDGLVSRGVLEELAYVQA